MDHVARLTVVTITSTITLTMMLVVMIMRGHKPNLAAVLQQ